MKTPKRPATPERSMATQKQPVLSFVEGAAVRWLPLVTVSFRRTAFLWFVSGACPALCGRQAKESNNSRRTIADDTLTTRDYLYFLTPQNTALL